MAQIMSGTFGYVLDGRWATMFRIAMDGRIVDAHGVEIDPIPLDELIVSKNRMSTIVAESGKRTRMDVLCTDGLVLPTEPGRWLKTLEAAIRANNSEKTAEIVIEAYKARYFTQDVEQAA